MNTFIKLAVSLSLTAMLAAPALASAQVATPTYWCGNYYSTYPCSAMPSYNYYQYQQYPYGYNYYNSYPYTYNNYGYYNNYPYNYNYGYNNYYNQGPYYYGYYNYPPCYNAYACRTW